VSSSNFRDTLVELIDTSPEAMDHPTADQWIAYQRGKLSAAEEERLQEHLMRCRDCFDLAEAAAAFADPDEEPSAGQEVETAALWRLLRPQLDPPEPSRQSRQNVREISDRSRRSSWWGRLPTTLAASFFVALVGLSVRSYQQGKALEAALAPRPIALSVDFASGERVATPASAERILTATTGPWMFAIHPADELPVYRLALRDAATGKEQWSRTLRMDQDRALKLELPEGLRPGHYRLELSDGSGGEAGKVLETFRLHVKEAGKGD
jgi:hypothetical protein